MKGKTIALKMIWHKKILYFNPLKGKDFPADPKKESTLEVIFPRAYGIALLHREPKKWSCEEDVTDELKQHAISEKVRKDKLTAERAGKEYVEEPVKKTVKKETSKKASKGGEE